MRVLPSRSPQPQSPLWFKDSLGSFTILISCGLQFNILAFPDVTTALTTPSSQFEKGWKCCCEHSCWGNLIFGSIRTRPRHLWWKGTLHKTELFAVLWANLKCRKIRNTGRHTGLTGRMASLVRVKFMLCYRPSFKYPSLLWSWKSKNRVSCDTAPPRADMDKGPPQQPHTSVASWFWGNGVYCPCRTWIKNIWVDSLSSYEADEPRGLTCPPRPQGIPTTPW